MNHHLLAALIIISLILLNMASTFLYRLMTGEPRQPLTSPGLAGIITVVWLFFGIAVTAWWIGEFA